MFVDKIGYGLCYTIVCLKVDFKSRFLYLVMFPSEHRIFPKNDFELKNTISLLNLKTKRQCQPFTSCSMISSVTQNLTIANDKKGKAGKLLQAIHVFWKATPKPKQMVLGGCNLH